MRFWRSKKKEDLSFVPFDGVVNTRKSRLIIRAGQGQKLSSAPKGARMRVRGREGDWYRITYKGIEGLVHADYIMPLDGDNFSEEGHTSSID